jgi:zinc transport system permease protein
MELLAEPLSLAFMRRALLAGTALGAVAALLGVFVVQRGLAFLADGLAHATFGGMALGLLLGSGVDHAVWVALPFTAAVAVAIGLVRRRSGLTGDVATGVFFSVAFALGVIFLALRPPARAVSVEPLLFGSILAVSPDVLAAVLVLSGVTAAVLALTWSQLAYATFDPELAALSGVRVAALEYLLLVLTALLVALGVKTVGVVLVSALFVIPAATATLLGRSLTGIGLRAVALGVSANGLGLLASYHLNMASGATVIVIQGAVFVAAVLFRRR